ncbi:hypothetical protein AMAG_01638 [Allomyces macrogynus ATCC 38327]|uniref:Uncharacterized protein n=1 Tax=Allomyces macrogynus (strain ATCC 38327) TaxID=578462 RepID=A0A0L0RZA7_ALLM3|nr:hypothetical protein AMAG_01638 [Allomyces macrogynus ATCC 38327]|eukprot:KNE55762.1 hypothetical protein AMAG_01638 [Allomyces macrogynus ATCC 38327]
MALPKIKPGPLVFSPVELVVPSKESPVDKKKDAASLALSSAGAAAAAAAAHGMLSTLTESTSELRALMDQQRPRPGVDEPAGTASPAFPTLPYKKLPREGAVSLLRKINTLDAVAGGNPTNAALPPGKGFQYQRKYKRAVVAKPIVSLTVSALKRRKNKREVTLQSNLDDVRQFRKGIPAPAPMLGLVKDVLQEFVDPEACAKRDAGLASFAADPTGRSGAPTETTAPGAGTTGGAASTTAATDLILNPFAIMCDDVVNSLAEFESAMQTFSQWKNDFLKQNVTSGVKLTLALMVAKIIRSQSDLSQIVLELVRAVRTFSSAWSDKLNAIAELEDEHARQTRAFDVAIRKLESMHGQVTRNRTNRQTFLWEYLTRKLLRKAQEEALYDDSSDEDDDEDSVGVAGRVGVSNPGEMMDGVGSMPGSASAGRAVGALTPAGVGVDRALSRQSGRTPLSTGPHSTGASTPVDSEEKRRARKREKKKAKNEAERVEEMRAILEMKKRERQETELRMKTTTVPAKVLMECKFNETLNKHFPHLPRALYAFHHFKHHSPMYYASEVFMLEAGVHGIATERVKRHHWTADDVTALSKPLQLRGLVRSNTSNALHHLTRESVTSSAFNPVKEREMMQKASTGLISALRRKFPTEDLRFDNLIDPAKPVGAPATIDPNKTWFTLQDVVELSLVHMQQIQMLREEYEQKVLYLTQMTANHQFLPKSWLTQDLPPLDVALPALIPSERKEQPAPLRTVRKGPPSPVKRLERSPTTRRRISLHRPRIKPNLNSSLLNMNFLDRMSRMAVDSKKRKEDLTESVLRSEFEANLAKVVQDKKVFSKDEVIALMERVLPAVFMPLPDKEPELPAFPSRPVSRATERLRAKSPAKHGSDVGYNLFDLARPGSRK